MKKTLPKWNIFDIASIIKGGWAGRELEDRKRRKLSEKSFKALVTSYGDLLQDARYTKVLEETEAVLGEQLTELVQHAKKCGHCAANAERIDLILQLVRRPAELVYLDYHRQRYQPKTEAAEGGV